MKMERTEEETMHALDSTYQELYIHVNSKFFI